MKMIRKYILWLVVAFFASHSLAAQDKYYNEMKQLQAAIQKHFYDSSAGYYKEVVSPKPGDNPYSYLWPLCALYQAANEIEKVEAGSKVLKPVFSIIEDYYDPAPPSPGYASYIMKLKGGDRFYDDNQWIGITAMDAYVRNKEKGHLQTAEMIYKYMMTGFDTVLTGGLYWQENKKVSKNTCSNGPGIILALQLYQATKRKTYLDTALLLYNWVNRELQTSSSLYYDNVSVDNRKIVKWVFSYNTGTMLQSNLYLYECTGNKKYLQQATTIADSSLLYFYGNKKFRDNYWFNAVLLRGYQHLLKYNPDLKYIKGFKQCVDDALLHNKNEAGLFKKEEVLDLVAQGGMLEILARFAWLERKYQLQ
nr:glycoside hydrolase family 76 protein [uncultured Lacibacter sp.]